MEIAGGSNGREQGGIGRVEHEYRSVAVLDEVFEFGSGGTGGQRNGDTAGAPDSPLDRDPGKAWGEQKSNSLLLEVSATGKQGGGYVRARFEELIVGIRAAGVGNGNSATIKLGAREEGKRLCMDHPQNVTG